ncbi:TIGR03862 family flavoprotein [Halotalea alkalilenta]|uniref:TIGR03862 family flavoprotein n=1 Tax=Halotalea alkalilenta TaxID=376489 RepID=UPI000480B430|nr:TIGR03862 family flavoprotein [Halotalea alkalilenta]
MSSIAPSSHRCVRAAVIGGGPAGLMAAEALAEAGMEVALFESMPTVGRKLLMAGVGGLNITHSEAKPRFVSRYGERAAEVGRWLEAFDAERLRGWLAELGIATFVGSSGRVFPAEMKAAPMLRSWLRRLRSTGVSIHLRHRWQGFGEHRRLHFDTPEGRLEIEAEVVVLALGGGSWARLGSDAAWWPWLEQAGVALAPLAPANGGFEVEGWSPYLRSRFAGAPLKTVTLRMKTPGGEGPARRGELIITEYGVEGGLIYACSAALRERLYADGRVTVLLDLAPDRDEAGLAQALARPRGRKSLASTLRSRAGIDGVKRALLNELAPREALADPVQLARAIKGLALELKATRPIDEAISTAGGVRFDALDDGGMLAALPGVFCAGEMLDWEAPTGGYLLTACLACGLHVGRAAAQWHAAGRPGVAKA